MDGPTIVAGLSVLVAGTTSLGAPIIAGRNQRRSDAAKFRHERELRREERNREALHAMADALQAVQGTVARLLARSVTEGEWDEETAQRFAEHSATTSAASSQQTRIALLLGRESLAAAAAQDCIDAYNGVSATAMAVAMGRYPGGGWAEQVSEFMLEAVAAYKTFLDEASKYTRGI